MSIFVSLLGLAFLILIHEAGHFFVARGVGMNPRKFYLGFPPAVVKTRRNGIEYGVGAIPLGGYVKIPGMHRPAPGDLDVHFGRAIEEAPPLGRPVGDLRRHLEENDYDGSGAGAGTRPSSTARRVDLAARSEIGRAGPHRRPGRARARRLLAGADLEAGRRHLRRARREPRPRGRHLRRALHVAQRQLPARLRASRHDRQGHRHRQRRARRHACSGGRRAARGPDPRDQRRAGRRRLDPPDDPGVARRTADADRGARRQDRAGRARPAGEVGGVRRRRRDRPVVPGDGGGDPGDREIARPARDRRRTRGLQPRRHRPGLVRGGSSRARTPTSGCSA